MSIISQMATAINGRLESVAIDRNTKFEAAVEHFQTEMNGFFATFSAEDEARENAEGQFETDYTNEFAAAKQRVDAAIADLKSNSDAADIDSVSEAYANLLAVMGREDDGLTSTLEKLINDFTQEESDELATLKSEIGLVSDVEAHLS